MIWISIPLMTTIDAMIIAVTVYAIWSSQLIAPSRRPSEPKTGLRWIALGLLLVCLFYFGDLASMYVLPIVASMDVAMEPLIEIKHGVPSSWNGREQSTVISAMDFEKVLIWMAAIGLVGLALTFAWVLATRG